LCKFLLLNHTSNVKTYCRGCWCRLFGGAAFWVVDVDGTLARWTWTWCICNWLASSARNGHLEHCLLLWTFRTCVASRSARAALYSHRVQAKGFVWVFICRFRHQLSTPVHEQYMQLYLDRNVSIHKLFGKFISNFVSSKLYTEYITKFPTIWCENLKFSLKICF